MAVGAICFAGCSKEEGTPATGDSRIRINPTIVTRATEVDFEDRDQIGLSLAASNPELSSDNNCLTYDAARGVFMSDIPWFTEEGVTADLVAYYPFAASGVPTTFAVKADQSAVSDYTASDLMTASKTGVTRTTEAVGMTFFHRLTKLFITVTNTMSSPVSKVIVKNLYGTADVDVVTGAVSPSADEGKIEVTANAVEAGKTYRAVVIPQVVALTVTVELADGTILSKDQAMTELKPTGQYPVNIEVGQGTLNVTISGDIQNWENEDPILPDTDPVAFEEGENSFTYAGETYGFKTLADGKTWMTENLRYVPSGKTPSADPAEAAGIWYPYTTDGTTQTPATDAQTIASKGYLYDYQTAFGVAITDLNCDRFEGIQGICPKGWHIPTLRDLIGLVGKSTKLADGTDMTDTSAPYYDSAYDGGKVPTLDAAGFNFPLSGTRLCAGIGKAGTYQKGNASGVLTLSYMMSSTVYKPVYNSTTKELSNIQFFGTMTNFNGNYGEGRVTCGYVGYLSGTSVRCVRDSAK